MSLNYDVKLNLRWEIDEHYREFQDISKMIVVDKWKFD